MKLRILVLCALFAYALGQTTPTTAPAAPTTTPAAPTTTEATTTGLPPATTTAIPVPHYPPHGKATTWFVGDDKNKKYCVLVKGAMEFAIYYQHDVTDEWDIAYVNVSENAVVSNATNCTTGDNDIQEFTLIWDTYEMTFTFKNSKSDGYNLTAIQLDFEYSDPPFNTPKLTGRGSTSNLDIDKSYELRVTADSYKCMEDIYVNLTSHNISTPNVQTLTDSIRLIDFQFIAFKDNRTATDDFGYATECDADFSNSDIVPIAVGCALAALVVIVLIAYLIGRKRSRQKGYQSV